MAAPAIEFDGVSKLYRGAEVGYRALRDDIVNGAGALLRLRERSPRPVVTALEDVSFTIPEGQSTALIGHNGAGKTTALRIATRITYPTLGRVRVRGRVGALLEVGTGMHPELTGRENVDLYGRILGLDRRYIAKRFDEIVEFSGVAHAIDQPVKQYSSGMQLRLGFSVAAHLEPDVLLVDEAISVGDAAFKYRCVQRMASLTREGRTLVFVTHELGAIETLCTRAILLRSGRIVEDGPVREVISTYLDGVEQERLEQEHAGGIEAPHLQITRTTLHDAEGREVDTVRSGEPLTVRLHYRAPEPLREPLFNVGLVDPQLGCFSLASMARDGAAVESLHGEGTLDCTFAALPLLPRIYEVWCGVRGEAGRGNLLGWQRLRLFRVEDDTARAGSVALTQGKTRAPILLPYAWSHRNGREGDD